MPDDDYMDQWDLSDEDYSRIQAEIRRREDEYLSELTRRRENRDRLEILKRARGALWNQEVEPRLVEPVIDTQDHYRLENAHLSVNSYGSLCLNSENMLIVDVDGSLDRGMRLHDYPTRSPFHCIFNALDRLDAIVGSNFKSQTYRVYATCAGYRVICISEPIAADAAGLALLRFLHGDPRYCAMCDVDRTFRARLTPKPYRVLGFDAMHFSIAEMQSVYDAIEGWDVCELVGGYRNGRGDCGEDSEFVHPDLIEQLRIHDDVCLRVTANAARA